VASSLFQGSPRPAVNVLARLWAAKTDPGELARIPYGQTLNPRILCPSANHRQSSSITTGKTTEPAPSGSGSSRRGCPAPSNSDRSQGSVMAGSLRGLKKFLTLFRAPKMEPPVSRQFHATTKAAERIPAAQRPSFRVELRGLEPLTPHCQNGRNESVCAGHSRGWR
jgi:hypothetical protein